jgi:hypothetical protein
MAPRVLPNVKKECKKRFLVRYLAKLILSCTQCEDSYLHIVQGDKMKGTWTTRTCAVGVVVMAMVGLFSCFSALNTLKNPPGDSTKLAPVPPLPKPRRTLAYCFKYGRFSNQVLHQHFL